MTNCLSMTTEKLKRINEPKMIQKQGFFFFDKIEVNLIFKNRNLLSCIC